MKDSTAAEKENPYDILKMLGNLGNMSFMADWRQFVDFNVDQAPVIDNKYILRAAKRAMLKMAILTNVIVYDKTFIYKSSYLEQIDKIKKHGFYSVLTQSIHSQILVNNNTIVDIFDASGNLVINIISLNKNDVEFIENEQKSAENGDI